MPAKTNTRGLIKEMKEGEGLSCFSLWIECNAERRADEERTGRPEGSDGFLNNSWLKECLHSNETLRMPRHGGRISASHSTHMHIFFRFVVLFSFFSQLQHHQGAAAASSSSWSSSSSFSSLPPQFATNQSHLRHEIRRTNRNLCRNNTTGRPRCGDHEGAKLEGGRGCRLSGSVATHGRTTKARRLISFVQTLEGRKKNVGKKGCRHFGPKFCFLRRLKI